MEVMFNDQNIFLDQPLTLYQFVKKMNIDSIGIAIAINKSICTKDQWDKTLLHHGDDILVIKATQGG
ncbi:sulfur carrier protein ThiS [Prolixibacteraceae bacterium]|nr:sulfur carrier protein ThiS [Prolixibacteraceae bacterium]